MDFVRRYLVDNVVSFFKDESPHNSNNNKYYILILGANLVGENSLLPTEIYKKKN